MTVVSPCVGLCKLDEATGFCLGCARTGHEIAGWASASGRIRQRIWDALPTRFETLDVSCRRLPWDTEQIRDFVLRQLRVASGTWVVGVVGAVAEFSAAPGNPVSTTDENGTITARTPGGKLRFHIDDHVRALTFETKDIAIEQSRIVLAVKRERARPSCAMAVTQLGPDTGAIDGGDRTTPVYDLGLGRKEARFCVRVGPGAAQDALNRADGMPFPQSLPVIGPPLVAESPARIVESALGRIEVDTRIPPPGGASPVGSHTHLLPEHLAQGAAMPVGMTLPRAYLPGAIFYPSG